MRTFMIRSLRLAAVLSVVGVASLLTRFDAHARAGTATRADGHDQLLALFAEWRTFQQPPSVDGVPQYTGAAMSAQYNKLPEFQRRLAALDPGGWCVPQQIDWYLVRAEMNGLDFDQRVR